MKTESGSLLKDNPVLKLAAEWAKNNAASSYRKGWHQAQQLLDQRQHPAYQSYLT